MRGVSALIWRKVFIRLFRTISGKYPSLPPLAALRRIDRRSAGGYPVAV